MISFEIRIWVVFRLMCCRFPFDSTLELTFIVSYVSLHRLSASSELFMTRGTSKCVDSVRPVALLRAEPVPRSQTQAVFFDRPLSQCEASRNT